MLDPDTGFTAPCAADAVMANQCGNVLGYVSPPRFYDGNYDKSEPLEVGNLGASARFNWDLGDVTLTSITSYDDNDKTHREDSDANPFAILNIDYQVASKHFTQKLRLTGSTGILTWVAGGYSLTGVLKP